MTPKKRIILVDDHVVVRNGLRELIEKIGPYEISVEFDLGTDLLKYLENNVDFDLIIMDLSMPEMHGDQVLDEMNSRGYSIPVLILTLNDDENKHIKLFRSGARGYLPKNCTATVLGEALNDIFTRGYYHNDLLAHALRNENSLINNNPQSDLLSQLTKREKEFLLLVCNEEEYTYEQIGYMMGVHRRTVDGYRDSVFNKFSIKSKTGLVLFVMKNGLLDYLKINN